MPELAVIIPTRNEAPTLPRLLGDLAAQREIRLEVVIADGGSRDDTRAAFKATAAGFPFPLRWIDAPAGRGRQMNAAVAHTAAAELLFLHADTRLPDPHLLAGGRDRMGEERARADHRRVGGHFGLRFTGRGDEYPLGYYFYEAKSHLNRSDCISGDQGQWLSRSDFLALGGFDERLPYLEDSRLAAALMGDGEWVTLPGTLETSSRRFIEEGFAARQTLNALIRCFDAIGFHRFLHDAPRVYAEQASAGRLDLAPLLALAHRLSLRGGWTGWLRWWYLTGKFVRDSAWHLAFAWDCQRNLRRGVPPGEGDAPTLARFDRPFDLLTDNPVGRAATMGVTMAWFFGLRLRLARAKTAKAQAVPAKDAPTEDVPAENEPDDE